MSQTADQETRSAPSFTKPAARDYSLVGPSTLEAIQQGLAEATWYQSPVPKEQMRQLLQRRNGPAIRDTLIWFGILILSGGAGYLLWQAGSWWALLPFAIYGVIYGTTSDSRWHESSHGTAFKSDWMNNALYEIASFMVMRESTLWRWSHTRHHSDTIIVGRDPEIAVPRPPDLLALAMSFFALGVIPKYFKHIILHSLGILTAEEKTFIPESEYGKVIWRARIYVLIYATVVGLALWFHTILPMLFIGLPNIYGTWLMPIYGYTQHAGLAENVLDHRLNCRTVYMNAVNRYLYWNMNYHVEHHMFPLVPYHNLPKLHEIVKQDMPKPYSGLFNAWREIIPAVLRQTRNPSYFVERPIPTPTVIAGKESGHAHTFTAKGRAIDGWVEVCAGSFVKNEDVIRFDHEGQTYAIYRDDKGTLYATDGMCTHGNTHLSEGFVKGNLVECPKHNGRFDITDGSPQRQPVCVGLRTFKVKEHDGKIFFALNSAGGAGLTQLTTTYRFRVVSNLNVATFIKELVLEPEAGSPTLKYQPGDYIQISIPVYEEMPLSKIDVTPPFDRVWAEQRIGEARAANPTATKRNYSMATNPAVDKQLRFNVRIATPPRGTDFPAGAGSSYVHALKPGDIVTAVGPFGTFHVKDTDAEMIYIGGGAGMAPLRSHLSHLFDTLKTTRKVSYWYGARSLGELFYQDYFDGLSSKSDNFKFHVALSEPQPQDNWTGRTGFIHEVLLKEYLAQHPDPKSIEYYLCGPPVMVKAATAMLQGLGVDASRIAFDEF